MNLAPFIARYAERVRFTPEADIDQWLAHVRFVGKAKITGRMIDRRKVGDAGAFDSWTDEELVEEAVRLARSLGIAGPHLVEDDSKKSL
jgi:hypothetical protein